MERVLFRTSLQDSIEYIRKDVAVDDETQTIFSRKDLFPSKPSPTACIDIKLKTRNNLDDCVSGSCWRRIGVCWLVGLKNNPRRRDDSEPVKRFKPVNALHYA